MREGDGLQLTTLLAAPSLHCCEKERQDLEEIIKVSISCKNDKSCICEMFNVIEETWRVGMN